MGTSPLPASEMLSAVLFGKARRAVLGLLYGHPEDAFYLRQIRRASGVGMGAVQRELQQLTAAGILTRRVSGRQVYYQANADCPVFEELRRLVLKTAGVADVLRTALAPLADRIRVACIFGSIARGDARRGSDIDLLVIGDVTFGETVAALGPAQATLAREVNPTVYPPAEFRNRIAEGQHFLTAILEDAKIFVIGDARELARLAE